MSHPDAAESTSNVLTPADAERLLARASHLDAVRGDAVPVGHLRAAAAEVGIGSQAFDAALAEVRAEGASRPPTAAPSARRLRARLAGAVAVVLVAGGLATAWLRPVAGTTPTAPTVEEGVLLRCLAPGEAAELVRPLLTDGFSTVTFNPRLAPQVLTIRTTPDQLRRAKALLAGQEGAAAGACVAPAASGTGRGPE